MTVRNSLASEVVQDDDSVLRSFARRYDAQLARRRHLLIAAALTSAAIVVLLMGIWQTIVALKIANPVFVGSPSEVISAFWNFLTSGDLVKAGVPTVEAICIAFVLSASAGTVIGLILSESAFLRRVFMPLFVAANSVPRIALAPITIVWFGIGATSKVVLAVSLVVLIQINSTVGALQNVDPDLTLLCKTLGANRLKTLWRVKVPWALGGIFAGMRLCIVYSVLSVVAVEMIASSNGLGQRIAFYSNTFAISEALAMLLSLSIVSVVLTFLVGTLERLVSSGRD